MMLNDFLHLSKFGLGAVAIFLNIGSGAPTLCAPWWSSERAIVIPKILNFNETVNSDRY